MEHTEKSQRAAMLLTEAARARLERDHARACALLGEAVEIYRDLAHSAPSEERRLKALRGYGAALYQLTVDALFAEQPARALCAARQGYHVIAHYGIRPTLQLVKLRTLGALALLDLDRPQEALAEIEAAFEELLKEKSPLLRAEAAVRLTWVKGLVLFALRRYEEAIEHLDRAYIHFQNRGQCHLWHVVEMAEALAALGRREEALEFYRVGVGIVKRGGTIPSLREFRVEMITSL